MNKDLKLIWLKPSPSGLHEATIITATKSQTYSINQKVVEGLVSYIEDQGLILVTEKPRYPL